MPLSCQGGDRAGWHHTIEELLIPEPETVHPAQPAGQEPEAPDGGSHRVRPRNRAGRSLPPL